MPIKTLRNVEEREEIAARLGRLRVDSARRWRRMSARGMVCHLSDSFRGVMGEKALASIWGVRKESRKV